MLENIFIAPEIMLVGCCGAYCGLCTKYQVQNKNKCLGCREKEHHTQCYVYKCCDDKRKLFSCYECEKYPCEKYLHRKLGTKTWKELTAENLRIIKNDGLEHWLKDQYQRRLKLGILLRKYNNGCCTNFYCTVCQLMPLELLNISIERIEKRLQVAHIDDKNSKVRISKATIRDLLKKASIDL